MSRRKRKDKEVAKLRREVEALRAQLKVSEVPVSKVDKQSDEVSKKAKEAQKPQTGAESAVIDVRSDLRKTAILTVACLLILLGLYLVY